MNLLALIIGIASGIVGFSFLSTSSKIKNKIDFISKYKKVSLRDAQDGMIAEIVGLVMAPPIVDSFASEGGHSAIDLSKIFYLKEGADSILIQQGVGSRTYSPGETLVVFGKIQRSGGYLKMVSLKPEEPLIISKILGSDIRKGFEKEASGTNLLMILCFLIAIGAIVYGLL